MTNSNPDLGSYEPSTTSGGADSLIHSFDQLSLQVPDTTNDVVEEEILWPRSAQMDTPSTAMPSSVSFNISEDLPDTVDGFVLVRGDYGTKTYTPRPRGAHGHRSTKSESAVALIASPAPNGLEQPTVTPAAIVRGSMAERWDYAFAHGPGKGAARTPLDGRDAGDEDLKLRESKKKWSEELEGEDTTTEIQRPVLTSSVDTQAQQAPARPHSTGEITSVSRPVAYRPDAVKTTKRGRSKKSKGKAVKPGQGSESGSGAEAAGATSEPQVQAPLQKSKPRAKAAARSNTARTLSPAAPASSSGAAPVPLHWSKIAKRSAGSVKESDKTNTHEKENGIQQEPISEVGAAAPVPLHWSKIAKRSVKQSDSTNTNDKGKGKEIHQELDSELGSAPVPLHWSEIASGKRKRRASLAKQRGNTNENEKDKEVQQQGKLKVKAKPKRLGRKKEVQMEGLGEEVIAPSPAPSTPRGLGQRSVVDDISENGDFPSLEVMRLEKDRLLITAYDEAVKFMNSCV